MLTDGEYETMLQTAKDIHETEQKRLADEEAARKAEADWLEKIRVDQEIEARIGIT